jgi:hypothetical protein
MILFMFSGIILKKRKIEFVSQTDLERDTYLQWFSHLIDICVFDSCIFSKNLGFLKFTNKSNHV